MTTLSTIAVVPIRSDIKYRSKNLRIFSAVLRYLRCLNLMFAALAGREAYEAKALMQTCNLEWYVRNANAET